MVRTDAERGNSCSNKNMPDYGNYSNEATTLWSMALSRGLPQDAFSLLSLFNMLLLSKPRRPPPLHSTTARRAFLAPSTGPQMASR